MSQTSALVDYAQPLLYFIYVQWLHWQFQICQVTQARQATRVAEPLCHSRVSVSNNQKFTRACPGLKPPLRGWQEKKGWCTSPVCDLLSTAIMSAKSG